MTNWQALTDQRVEEAKEEIRAMAEHARRSIGQRNRRANEKIALDRFKKVKEKSA
jgi:hypothetical protein